jgi:hypothetical protein
MFFFAEKITMLTQVTATSVEKKIMLAFKKKANLFAEN